MAMKAADEIGRFDFLHDKHVATVNKDKMSLVVTNPGFYSMESLSSAQHRFKDVFFAENGKYSFVKIHKMAREATRNMMLMDDEVRAVLVGKLSDNYNQAFDSTLLVGELRGDKWNDLKNSIHAVAAEFLAGVKKKDVEIKDKEIEGVYLLDNRYIPMISFNSVLYTLEGDNGKHSINTGIPILKTNNPEASSKLISSLAAQMIEFSNIDSYEIGKNVAIPFAYDTKAHAICINLDIVDAIYGIVNRNINSFKADIKSVFGQSMAPAELIRECSLDFAKNGAGEFNVTKILPKIVQATWSEWKKRDDVSNKVTHAGYSAEISLKNKIIIGRGAKYSGFVDVRMNNELGRPWLIHSAWCQRVTAWSKNQLGVVDQKYDIWPLGDWLSGPFAEKNEITLKEAPLMFAGNIASDNRKDAIKALRNRLNKIA